MAFVMLNPSSAGEVSNDPTIRRCIGFAQSWGFGSLEVVNLFAFRTADPRELFHANDPVGPENDQFIRGAAASADTVVVAWGNSGARHSRDVTVLSQLADLNLFCFGCTKCDQPKHPLYLRSDLSLRPFQVRSTDLNAPKGDRIYQSLARGPAPDQSATGLSFPEARDVGEARCPEREFGSEFLPPCLPHPAGTSR